MACMGSDTACAVASSRSRRLEDIASSIACLKVGWESVIADRGERVFRNVVFHSVGEASRGRSECRLPIAVM
jgi:hypothetical protein